MKNAKKKSDSKGWPRGWTFVLILLPSTAFSSVWYYWDTILCWLKDDSISQISENLRNLSFGTVAFATINFLIPLAIWRTLNLNKQANTSERSATDDRLKAGAKLLGNDDDSARRGGVIILEILAEEHKEIYHVPVMDILSGFIRFHSSAKEPTDPQNDVDGEGKDCQKIIERAAKAIGGCRKGLKPKKRRLLEGDFFLDLEKANLKGARMMCADFSKANLGKAVLQNTVLIDASLEGANLNDARLEGADLQNAVLKDASLEGANLEKANLEFAKLQKAVLKDASLEGANLKNANLEFAKLQYAVLIDASLEGANLKNANLEFAKLQKAVLIDASLEGANLKIANLEFAKLQNAALIDVFLEGASLKNANLEFAKLQYAALIDVSLKGANLKNANLEFAKLQNSILNDAYLEYANLNNANLVGAILKDTYLKGANLKYANLQGADLEGVDIKDANLERVNFTGVVGLTQIMLNSVKPTAPPSVLPEDLHWPFKKGDDGRWLPLNSD